jgi:hypothetical protein
MYLLVKLKQLDCDLFADENYIVTLDLYLEKLSTFRFEYAGKYSLANRYITPTRVTQKDFQRFPRKVRWILVGDDDQKFITSKLI